MTTTDTPTTTPFRITPADPEVLRRLEAEGPDQLRDHLALIRGGLEALPGVPGDAIYGAVTLRTIALRPEVFTHLFLTEHHAAKQGSVDRSIKELVSLLVAARIEGNETPAVRSAVEFAAAAALDPRSIEDADVQAVRDHGYDDAARVELVITALVAYTLSAVNQVFDLREGEG